MDRRMAEAAVETPAVRFFCHKCNQEINPVLPEYICPRCQSGFIEELAQGPPEPSIEDSDDDLDHAAQFRELWNSTIMDVLRRLDRGPGSGGMVDDNLSPDAPSSSASDSMVRRRSPGRAGRRPHPESQARQPLEGIIHQIFANLTGTTGFISNQGLPVLVNLHGNPGDYAWGRGGLDAVITQLLNQLDGTGPPPLAKEKIEQIPTVKIAQEQVDKLLQCTVCMEEFKTGEQVKRLPCQHHFHPDCIVPWLELHGTCPICRKLLNEEAGSEPGAAGSSSGPSRAAGAGLLPRSQSERPTAFMRMHMGPRSSRSTSTQQQQQPQQQPPSASSSSSSTSSQPPTSRPRRHSPANSSTSRRGSHSGGNQYSVYDFNDECD
uniref:RING-type E3 ubiquitin transferase n=1 Tax=Amblyomma triste TaxID=251400 RepID=A0A023G8N6_AMBTT